jgi:hypothetical protein
MKHKIHILITLIQNMGGFHACIITYMNIEKSKGESTMYTFPGGGPAPLFTWNFEEVNEDTTGVTYKPLDDNRLLWIAENAEPEDEFSMNPIPITDIGDNKFGYDDKLSAGEYAEGETLFYLTLPPYSYFLKIDNTSNSGCGELVVHYEKHECIAWSNVREVRLNVAFRQPDLNRFQARLPQDRKIQIDPKEEFFR